MISLRLNLNFKVCILVAVTLIQNNCFLIIYSKLLHSDELISLNVLLITFSVSESWITSSGLFFLK